ncbi:MAG: sodium:proton antiporter, partial [Alphaproteobacteria bacterium]|nr:sodium:proton antiporter [Alphaproteobacteria bacterium]
EGEIGSLEIEGWANILLLVGVVLVVLFSGLWVSGITFTINHVPLQFQNIVRDLLLLGLVFVSLKITSKEHRKANAFSWFPIVEVAKLFAGIFITIIPAIAILRAGSDGALAPLLNLVSDGGEPVNAMYFWITGTLSAFLDNAPTYLVFFSAAGGDAATLMGPLSGTLLAISCGAVFMGAMSYIGNAPNFMVRTIAEERGIPMPSFFGYIGWSALFLLPVFLLVTWVFF